MVRVLSFALLLLPSLLAAQSVTDTASRPIELQEALRLAKRNSPLTVFARGYTRVTRASVKSAYFAFVPDLSVFAQSNWRRGQTGGQAGEIITVTNTTFLDQFSARLDLFDGGRRFFNIRAAQAANASAEATDILQEYQVALDVKQQYFNVLAAQEAEQAARAQLAEAEQQLRVASVRVAAGAASRSDSLRAMVAVGNARLAILDAENRVQLANASLTRLVGTGFPVTAIQESAPAVAAADTLGLAYLTSLAEDGPLVMTAEADLAVAKATARATRTLYLPTISATYGRSGFGYDRRFGLRDPFTYSSGFTLSLNFPLLDGLQREESVVRANVAEDNAEATLRDYRLRAQQELTQSLGLLRNAGQRVEVQTSSVAATEQDLLFQQQRYALGAATLLDVLTSQAALNTARNALITARFDQRVARARLEALVGRSLETVR